MPNQLSDMLWYDVNPLSTLYDIMNAMEPGILIDIEEINGGSSSEIHK